MRYKSQIDGYFQNHEELDAIHKAGILPLILSKSGGGPIRQFVTLNFVQAAFVLKRLR